MRNSYPFIHDYRDKVPIVAMAVQEPTLEYVNPATAKPFTREGGPDPAAASPRLIIREARWQPPAAALQFPRRSRSPAHRPR